MCMLPYGHMAPFLASVAAAPVVALFTWKITISESKQLSQLIPNDVIFKVGPSFRETLPRRRHTHSGVLAIPIMTVN